MNNILHLSLNISRILIFTFIFSLLSSQLYAVDNVVKIINIHDGDTVTIRKNGKKIKVRLLGIDAPELKQSFGTQSKSHLRYLLRSDNITFRKNGEDHYGRYLGTLYVSGENINLKMVEDGFAWHYAKYVKSNKLAIAQRSAEKRKVGIWASKKSPIPPWQYRTNQKEFAKERNTPLLASPIKGIAICIDMKTAEIKYFLHSCPKNHKAIIR